MLGLRRCERLAQGSEGPHQGSEGGVSWEFRLPRDGPLALGVFSAGVCIYEQGFLGILELSRCAQVRDLGHHKNSSLLPWNEFLCFFTPEVKVY